jgi:hypothetical protein
LPVDMRQSLRGCDLALRHALDHAFRRRLEVEVLGHQPIDERGQLNVPEAFPPNDVDRTLDGPAGHAAVIRRRPPGCFSHLRVLEVRPNDAAGQPDAQHRTGEARHQTQGTH